VSGERLLSRGKAAFFAYFLCGGKESDPAAQRSEAFGSRVERIAAYTVPTKIKGVATSVAPTTSEARESSRP
jgi:hypothetical protein